MMVEMISTLGTSMRVAEERVQEYLAAGCRLAAVPAAEKPAEEKPKRKTRTVRK